MPPTCDAAPARSGGFTLIELLAVVATMALIAAMVVPNLNLGGSRAVRAAAADLASALELARERAVLTGRVHAVVVDIAGNAHWVEWSVPIEEGPAPPPAADGAERELELVPPPLESDELVPLPGNFGRRHALEEPARILGVETDGGTADTGQVTIRIDGDGMTDPAAILIGDADGSYVVRVEVEPLADAVSVVNAE